MKLAAATLIMVSLLAAGLWCVGDAPLTPKEIQSINEAWNPPPLHVTRGPAMHLVAFLQTPSGVSVDTQIPIWGVLLVIVGAVAAFAALKMQMATHEKNDDQRFEAVSEMLTEIRGDIKKLIGWNNHFRHEEDE